MTIGFDPYAPLHFVKLQIQQRWEACESKPPMSFEQFCHITCEARMSWMQSLPHSVLASRPTSHAALVVRMWLHLRTAADSWAFAAEMVPTPRRALLLEALEHCLAADGIHAELLERRAKTRAARVKGGQRRHTLNDPARDHAALLLGMKRPATGWPNPLTAARVIESDLRAFIIENRLAVATGTHLVKTIVAWINKIPTVTAAFTGASSY